MALAGHAMRTPDDEFPGIVRGLVGKVSYQRLSLTMSLALLAIVPVSTDGSLSEVHLERVSAARDHSITAGGDAAALYVPAHVAPANCA
jgi:hypothetical protein